MTRPLTADVRELTRLSQCAAAGAARRYHHPVAELRQIDEVSSVEGQLHDLTILDDVADLGVGALQQWGARLDADLFGHRLHTEREVHGQRPTDFEGESLSLGSEARQRDGDIPLPDSERRKEVAPIRLGDTLHHRPGSGVSGGDSGPRQHTTRRVTDDAADFTGVELSESGRNVQQAHEQYGGETHGEHPHSCCL